MMMSESDMKIDHGEGTIFYHVPEWHDPVDKYVKFPV
jgi:hypothetical protein